MMILKQGGARSALVALAAAVDLMAASPASAVPTDLPGTTATADQIAAATMLAQSLCLQITGLTTPAPADQVEAAIVYALSQSTQPLAVQKLALDRIPSTCSLGASMSAGLRNAQIALLRGTTSGTAGLTTARNATSAGGSSGYSAFSSPAIAVGGGSVNYTSTNAR